MSEYRIGLDISKGLWIVTVPVGETLETEIESGFETKEQAEQWLEENRNYLNQ